VLHSLDSATYPMAESRVKAVKNKADISAGKLAEPAKDLMSAGVLIDARCAQISRFAERRRCVWSAMGRSWTPSPLKIFSRTNMIVLAVLWPTLDEGRPTAAASTLDNVYDPIASLTKCVVDPPFRGHCLSNIMVKPV
jgi:hypothetical protein